MISKLIQIIYIEHAYFVISGYFSIADELETIFNSSSQTSQKYQIFVLLSNK